MSNNQIGKEIYPSVTRSKRAPWMKDSKYVVYEILIEGLLISKKISLKIKKNANPRYK